MGGGVLKVLFNHELLFLYALRKLEKGKHNPIYKALRRHLRNKYGIEIDSFKVGKGLCIVHPYNITVSSQAVIGECCNLHKGVTIGRENRGQRQGAPVIGDKVWIGINATVVGNIKIGNDVMIAPNAFVNCDIPDHSIVVGNPCSIYRKENATEDYIIRYDL